VGRSSARSSAHHVDLEMIIMGYLPRHRKTTRAISPDVFPGEPPPTLLGLYFPRRLSDVHRRIASDGSAVACMYHGGIARVRKPLSNTAPAASPWIIRPLTFPGFEHRMEQHDLCLWQRLARTNYKISGSRGRSRLSAYGTRRSSRRSASG